MTALVSVRGQANVQSKLDEVTCNRAVYECIAREMQDMGYKRTLQQCDVILL